MSSVPCDALLDILQWLDRWTLDDVQLTNRRCRKLIVEQSSKFSLREVDDAVFHAPNNNEAARWVVRVGDPPTREISKRHEDTARLFTEFVEALSSSRVGVLTLHRKYIKRLTVSERSVSESEC